MCQHSWWHSALGCCEASLKPQRVSWEPSVRLRAQQWPTAPDASCFPQDHGSRVSRCRPSSSVRLGRGASAAASLRALLPPHAGTHFGTPTILFPTFWTALTGTGTSKQFGNETKVGEWCARSRRPQAQFVRSPLSQSVLSWDALPHQGRARNKLGTARLPSASRTQASRRRWAAALPCYAGWHLGHGRPRRSSGPKSWKRHAFPPAPRTLGSRRRWADCLLYTSPSPRDRG